MNIQSSLSSGSQCVELLTQFRVLCTHTSGWRWWCTEKFGCEWEMTECRHTECERMWVYVCICGAISLRRIMLNFQTYERNDNDGVDMSSTHSFGSATYNTNQFWKREKKTVFSSNSCCAFNRYQTNRMNMRPFLGWPWIKVFFSSEMWCAFSRLLLALERDNLKCAHKTHTLTHNSTLSVDIYNIIYWSLFLSFALSNSLHARFNIYNEIA